MELSNIVETIFPKKVKTFESMEPRFNSESFNTPLPKGTEVAYTNWKAINAPNDSGYDYDLQGAFLAGVKRDPVTGHMPDTFKKPNHSTFSNQSKYATGKWAKYAGSWQGEQYIKSKVYN